MLFRIGNWLFTTYAFLAGTAIATGFAVILWFDAMHGMDVAYLAKIYVFLLIPPILVGLRLFSVMLEWRELFRRPIATLIKPGYMMHGGLAGGFVGFLAISSIVDVPLLRLLDASALALPLAEAIARLGCFVYGCCWGRPIRGRWGARFGVRYTSKDAKVVRAAPHLQNVKIHPAQLYALVVYLGLFTVFYALLPYLPFDGALAGIYLIGHSIIRYSLEHFRQDDRGRLWGKVTHTNLYSAIMIIAGVLALFHGATYGVRSVPDMGIRMVHVLANTSVLPWIVLCGLIFGFAYGVHYKQVGSWIQHPDPDPDPRP
ncbi:prolipoprotein diacylglyceryl transferase [Paraliomyxa miuraensis]|uniref:prolipoprotein diacylglyceryl transferase n=1 Tax=Paraliomyxa miuraensis TaxID=376150 RepID=UPI002256AD0C|nr:prolipoprotein diacylglyceryl transferase family protein [Paraliomyxa miuraensis]MCX4246769.1 prolipoprotein diacylglyceryl transferase [Paraliomyxa miuraensis]